MRRHNAAGWRVWVRNTPARSSRNEPPVFLARTDREQRSCRGEPARAGRERTGLRTVALLAAARLLGRGFDSPRLHQFGISLSDEGSRANSRACAFLLSVRPENPHAAFWFPVSSLRSPNRSIHCGASGATSCHAAAAAGSEVSAPWRKSHGTLLTTPLGIAFSLMDLFYMRTSVWDSSR